ncbi:MAG TPA: hypothetical protein PLL30_09490 [Candidatus Krumholzibacteria bacterium]|nr:hypothetical protein [Candidatus Krumholzibacteria bacterium]HPD71995.1 hypothetical protein [Candidatus Krumholzibacteria bacterium]HRY41072.1 hypothetical protein [Candidatus Krumholzibacteria bacterium]
MDRRHLASLAFGVSVALGLCHTLCSSIQLPDEVASRFDLTGVPVALTARDTLIDVHLTVIVAVAAAFLILAGLVLKTPARWLNLPHRAWWFAAERERLTRLDLTARLLWLGAASQLLIFDYFHRTVRVNLGRAASLEGFWLDLAVYAGFVLGWLALVTLRYRKVPADAR